MSGIDPTAPLMPEGPGAPVAGEPPPPGRSRRSLVWIAIATLVLGGTIGAGVALVLSGGDEDSEVGVATTTSTVPATTTPAPTTKPPSAPGTTSAPATAAPTTTTTSTSAPASAPVITQFVVAPPLIGCAPPGAAVSVTIVWATENATTVTIASPDATKSFAVSGSTAASFPCLPGINRVYTLTATGPGGSTSQSAVVQMVVS
ncbi:MAG: hypothetical protein WDA60_12890 [Acidimicrobiia bacterium]